MFFWVIYFSIGLIWSRVDVVKENEIIFDSEPYHGLVNAIAWPIRAFFIVLKFTIDPIIRKL